MKRLLWLLILLLCLSPASPARASTVQEELEQQLEGLDLSGWEEGYRALVGEDGVSLGEFIRQAASGEKQVSFQGVISWIQGQWLGSLGAARETAVNLLTAAALLCLLSRMAAQKSAASAAGGRMVQWALWVLTAARLSLLFRSAWRSVETMLRFGQAVVPVLAPLTLAVGGGATAGLMTSTLGVISVLIGSVFKPFLMGGLWLTCCLSMLSGMGERQGLSAITGLLQSLLKAVVGGLAALFAGLLTAQNLLTASSDSVSVRTAKYAVDTALPFAGGMFKDMVTTVIGCTALLRGALGMTALCILMWMMLKPVLEIGAMWLTLRVCGAMAAPVGMEGFGTGLEGAAKSLSLLMVTVLLAGVMLFVLIALGVQSGSRLAAAG